jgi:hypothetical protein
MALFEKLKDTKLKSLKFGEKGTAGDSTKPYIVTDINKVDTPFNRLRLTKFDDGLIRGGAVGAINSSAVDTLRISKFLIDFPKGPLFIAKQVGLQLSNPPLETKQLPTNRVGKGIIGKAIAGASNVINKLNNLVGGPTRIYNLGINTLAQVPLNAFGGHVARHGFLPRLDNSQKYESVVTENNKNGNNRLEGLYNNFFQSNSSGTTFRANVFNKTISDNFGGASSVYGIGRTTIRRTTVTGREFDITPATIKEVPKTIQQGILEHVYDPNTIYQKYKLKYDSTSSIDDFKYKPQLTTSPYDVNISLSKVIDKVPKYEPVKRDTSLLLDDILPNQSDVTDLREANFLGEESKYFINQVSAFYNVSSSGVTKAFGDDFLGYQKTSAQKSISNYLPKTTNKKYDQLITNKVVKDNFSFPANYDDLYAPPLLGKDGKAIPGTEQLSGASSNLITDKEYTPNISINRNPLNDRNNFSPIPKEYDYALSTLERTYQRDDANNFSIVFTPLDPFTGKSLSPISFVGYINGYSEIYDSSWDSTKYNGRSDLLYTFNSYKKTANFKLKIPAFDYLQIEENHRKLLRLQDGTAGTYKDNRLGGIITYVDLGYYLGNVPCIITSINISIPDDASWDLQTKQSMVLEATFNLIVIGDETPGLNIVRVVPTPPKVTIVPPPIPKIKPEPIPRKKIKYVPTKPIPPAPIAKADATVTKFTSTAPGNGTYKGVNAAQQSEALKKKLKLKPRTKQQEAALEKALKPK